MSQRVTVVLGDELLSKLRKIHAKKLRDTHAKKLRDTHAYVSFSGFLNEILEAGLKKK